MERILCVWANFIHGDRLDLLSVFFHTNDLDAILFSGFGVFDQTIMSISYSGLNDI